MILVTDIHMNYNMLNDTIVFFLMVRIKTTNKQKA